MIESGIMEYVANFGALGIVAFVVYFQQTTANKTLNKLQAVVEKNTHVIEYFIIEMEKKN